MFDQPPKSIHPEAEALVEYWLHERGGRLLPDKDALNPLKLRRWIGDISIVELHDGPKKFYVKLHGGKTQQKIGNDLTRRYFEDALDAKTLEFAIAPYRAAYEALRPTHSLFVPKLYPSVFTKLERLVLPFGVEIQDAKKPKVEQFLTWVGPTDRNEVGCDSVYDMVDDASGAVVNIAEAVELEILPT